jgi:hypothetical protein
MVTCGFSRFVLKMTGPRAWMDSLDEHKGVRPKIIITEYPSSIVCATLNWLVHGSSTIVGGQMVKQYEEWLHNASDRWGIPQQRWLFALYMFAKQYDMESLHRWILDSMLAGQDQTEC